MKTTLLVIVLLSCFYNCRSQVAVDSIIRNKQVKSIFLKDIEDKFKDYLISNRFDTTNGRLSKSTKVKGYCKTIVSVLSYNSYSNFNSGLINAYIVDYDFFQDTENFQMGFLELVYANKNTADRKFKEFNKKRTRGRSLEGVIRSFKLLKVENRIIVIESFIPGSTVIKNFIALGNFLNSEYEESKMR